MMRVYECPPGYTMNRNDVYPTDDNCVQCKADEYLLSSITLHNMSISCQKCPVGATCPGVHILPFQILNIPSMTLVQGETS
jgi:hypothetical protein